jgi:hypothetical protein
VNFVFSNLDPTTPTTEQQQQQQQQQATKTTTDNNSNKEMQCEWCNRFFTSQHGVERHKTYCAWHPQRLKALKEQRKRRRDEKAYYKENKKEKVAEKPEDEGCPNSPTSVESDDTFHVTNNHVVQSIIEAQSKQSSQKQQQHQRPTVLRSSVKNCPCGCEYVNLAMELEYDEEEIDVESL